MQKRNYSKAVEEDLKKQDAQEQFVSFLDSVYYEGYAQQLAKENPVYFTHELNEYFENHFRHA